MRPPRSLVIGGAVLLTLAAGPALSQRHDEHAHHDHAAAETPTVEEAAASAEHVPPDPPATSLHDMPYAEMARMMAMDDTATGFSVKFQELERRFDSDDSLSWEGEAWWGGDYDKLWLKTEGDRRDGGGTGSRTELLWDRAVGRWWNAQAGFRHDSSNGAARDWLAFGVEGLATFGIELEATLYLGDAGRTAARVSARHDLLLTQRWVLQPEVELHAYGRRDDSLGRRAGLAEVETGLRLRYEVRRELAPYVGVTWSVHRGRETDRELQAVAGLRFWF